MIKNSGIGAEIVNISEMLASNASMYPDDTALIELTPSEKSRKVVTWKEFDERANRLAKATQKILERISRHPLDDELN